MTKTDSYKTSQQSMLGGICLKSYNMLDISRQVAEIQPINIVIVGAEQNEETIEINEQEVDLLARAMYNEVGVLGHDAMYLCGCVILNRVDSDNYPNDIYGVIYDDGQYHIVKNGHINRQASGEAYDIARDLLTNGSTIPSDIVYQAQFRQGSYVYKQIGNTYFCGK